MRPTIRLPCSEGICFHSTSENGRIFSTPNAKNLSVLIRATFAGYRKDETRAARLSVNSLISLTIPPQTTSKIGPALSFMPPRRTFRAASRRLGTAPDAFVVAMAVPVTLEWAFGTAAVGGRAAKFTVPVVVDMLMHSVGTLRATPVRRRSAVTAFAHFRTSFRLAHSFS